MKPRVFVLICLCIALLLSLSSCSKKATTDLSEFERLTVDGDAEQEPFAQTVYLIVPDGASGELVNRAERFAAAITSQTGVPAIVKYDSQPIILGEDSLRILIGNTSDVISSDLLKGLRTDDYICKYERGAVVIGGKSDFASILAIEKFEKDILPTASYAFFMSEDAHFESLGEYDVKSLTLNGFNICDFTIAYGSDDGYEREIALFLGKYISDKSGYELEVKRYDKLSDNTAKIIYLRLDNKISPNTADIYTTAEGFEIRASDAYVLSGAVAKFAALVIPSDISGDASVTVEDCNSIKYPQNSVSFSLLALDYKTPTSDFVLKLGDCLNDLGGDAICVLDSKEEINDDVRYGVPESYSTINNDGFQLVCTNDRADGSSCKKDKDAIKIEFLSASRQKWSVLIADSLDVETVSVIEPCIIFLKQEISETSDIIKVGEVVCGFDGSKEKYFIYTPRILDAEFDITFDYTSDGFYLTCCSVSADMRYHADFLALKNTVE